MGRPICIILLAITLVIAACSNPTEQVDTRTVFRYNESKGITSLDPAFARNQTNIWPVTQLFNGLVQLDDQLRVAPCIARHWEISPDGKTYTFFIRDDVHFHPSPQLPEDRKVTASDFVYSFERIRDPAIASPGKWIFDEVSGESPFSAVNDTTLQIQLENPFPPFLSMLAMPYCSVVPEEVVEERDIPFGEAPVGTGPFRFAFWKQDEKLVLLKNADYFEVDTAGDQLPYLDAVNVSFIKDKQSEFLEFLKGNLDFLSGVHQAYKDELLTRSGTLNPEYADRFQIFSKPYLNTEYLGILQQPATSKDSPLTNRDVRLAMNLGFDRAKMMKYMRNNLGYPANAGMIPPGLPGHMKPGTGVTYDPDSARQLLARAGYSGAVELPVIPLTTTSDYLDLCEFIQFELGKIGIRIDIQVATGGAFRNMVANGNLPFFRGSWIADYADAENYLALFYSPNHTPAGPNYTRFTSDNFDRLYEQIIRISDPEERYAIYRSMDSIMMAEAPVIPLYYDMVVRFAPSGIYGFEPDAMNNLVLKRVRKEP